MCVQGEELTRAQSVAAEFALTEEQAQELIEHIDAYEAVIDAASSGGTVGGLADSYITQAVTLYNSLPRETTPVVGITREIPESLVPYYEGEEEFVEPYEKALALEDLKIYLNMIYIVSILDHEQLTNFVVQVSVKSVPAKVDCALDRYITEFIKDRALLNAVEVIDPEATLPEADILILKQWSGLHNPILRSLGMFVARSQITNEEQIIDFLEPYLEETDKIFLRGLINVYLNMVNQAGKDKLLELSNIAAAREDTVSEKAARDAIEYINAYEELFGEVERGIDPGPVDPNINPFLNQ